MTAVLLSVAIWHALIAAAADRYDVPPDLVEAIVAVESGGNPRAVGPAGERGLMQLLPATAARLGVRDAFDPAQNVDAGTRYLAAEIRAAGGDVATGLAMYNCGRQCGLSGRWPATTRAYVSKVLSRRSPVAQQPPSRAPGRAEAVAHKPAVVAPVSEPLSAKSAAPVRLAGSRHAVTARAL